ncbi:hypothetical protein G7Z17_g6793 [Cylindrodendrum hubeiense]|uniref:Amino acid permease/ SLC12A domain-containing protein n=1 Tax=Cylindrodendrum hubeiense TaxID=595255 RepID=A0A9P5HCK0_9HYPO|nr:hypothetical protein G7Z17_g6793 [Cylindrodendrum hubeiense]
MDEKLDHGKSDAEVQSTTRPASYSDASKSQNVEVNIHGTKRGLKSRHAQMIALGGTIGTGLFVGSSQGLRIGGPVFLLAAYILITIMVFGIVTATTEMSSYLPVPGSSMAYYGGRFVSPSFGFALGWMYWYIFVIIVPNDITAASLIIEYWNPPVHTAVWITLIMVLIIALNCFPVTVFGESEFWFASLKVFGIVGLLFMALVLMCGGGPNHDALGFRYWTQPGPVNEYLLPGASGRLVSFIATTTFSLYAFAFAPELLVVTAGEMERPRQNLPKAGKRYFYRLIIFYILGSFFIGLIVRSDNPQLLGGGSGAGASPWAIAARDAGIRGLDSVINGVILTSACSAGSSYLYLSSRALYSMALSGNAPAVFKKCSKAGIPYVAVAASASFCLLAFLNVSTSGATVFNWFVNLINTGGYMSWIAVCFIYLRFRKATFAQNVEELPYRSRFQPIMSYVCGVVLVFLMLLNGLPVFIKGNWNTSNFLTSYIGIPIFIAFYLDHKFTLGRSDRLMYTPTEIDLTSGLAEILADDTPAPERKGWKSWWRVLFE